MDIRSRLFFSSVALVCCLIAIIGNKNCIVMVSASHPVFRELQSVSANSVQKLHRTGYHFQPAKNWINDPNGPMYYNGVYHLFYQYNPKGSVWGNIIWAHSVSKDLINWVALPPAIYPTKSFDIQGCWSGSATILPGNRPIILYTGVDAEGLQVQNYAIPVNESDPYLIQWQKPDDNPLMYPKGVNASAFRDPTTAWFEGGHWKTLIGGRRKHRGMIFLYRSRDFKHWLKAKHPFHHVPDADVLECPDFFPVSKSTKQGVETSTMGKDVKHVLKISYDNGDFDYYTIGTYYPRRVKNKYVLDNPTLDGWNGLRIDYGKYYASKTFFDPIKNRRILWGWANESCSAEVDVRKGWAGIQTIPRTLWLDENGKQLLQWPIEEVEQLRTQKIEVSNVVLKPGERCEVKGITAAQADVDVIFSFSNLNTAEQYDPSWSVAQNICYQKGAKHPGGVGPFGLLTLASQNLEEYTAIFFRIFKSNDNKHRVVLCADGMSSSLGTEFEKRAYAGFVDVDLSTGKLSLRTLIDHSVVESFAAGGKTCVLTRVYPTLAINNTAHLYAFNNGTTTISIERLNAWSMKSPGMNVQLDQIISL